MNWNNDTKYSCKRSCAATFRMARLTAECRYGAATRTADARRDIIMVCFWHTRDERNSRGQYVTAGLAHGATVRDCQAEASPGLSLTQKKKNPVQNQVISKEPAGTPCAQPWLWQLAVGGWRQLAVGSWQLAVGGGWWWLAAVGGWRLVVGGSWQWLAVGGWSPLAVGGGWWLAVGGWRLVVGGWWRLAVDGSWRLAVGGPLGLSLRAVLSKKKKNLVP